MANNANSSNSTFTVLKPGEKSGNDINNVNEKKVLFTSVVSQDSRPLQNQEMDVVDEEHHEIDQNSK